MVRSSQVASTTWNQHLQHFKLMLCTLIGAIILSINIQVVLNMHLSYMMTSGMHRRPFEGRHLVGSSNVFCWAAFLSISLLSLFLFPLPPTLLNSCANA